MRYSLNSGVVPYFSEILPLYLIDTHFLKKLLLLSYKCVGSIWLSYMSLLFFTLNQNICFSSNCTRAIRSHGSKMKLSEYRHVHKSKFLRDSLEKNYGIVGLKKFVHHFLSSILESVHNFSKYFFRALTISAQVWEPRDLWNPFEPKFPKHFSYALLHPPAPRAF